MKIEKNQIEQIKTAFQKMQHKEDLLDLLNLAKPLIYGKESVPFQLKQLTYYIQKNHNNDLKNSKTSGEKEIAEIQQLTDKQLRLQNKLDPWLSQRQQKSSEATKYHSFKIKKKSGSTRTIHAPTKGLKAIQKTLAFILQCVFEPHQAANGFVWGRSIVDNAKVHVGNRYVYNIDLKDFFPSIDQARVWKCLQLSPFNLFDSVSLDEQEKIKSIRTGIRKLITDNKEEIYYYVADETVVIINDKKGNSSDYKRRLTSHIPNPMNNRDIPFLDRLSLHEDYLNEVNKILFDDIKRYLLNEENLKSLLSHSKSRLKLANMISMLCCTEMEVERKTERGDWENVKRNVIPQGAPTSPVITNIVCQKLDKRLTGVANRFGLKYSRYADDITFSSIHNVYQKDSDFIKELQKIIADQGFHIKESKTRLQKDGYRKEVTGLLVNEKVNVPKRYIKQLRCWLYYWERYGCDRASAFFTKQYFADKGHVKNGKPEMANVISGKLDYLKMVKGAENALYLKLKGRFDLLVEQKKPINLVVNIWEKEGIEKAMDNYYKDKFE